MGEGPDVLLLHGLGATKASFFDTAAALSHSYRVHAIDLPGFGGSCKPALARYGAPFFARAMLGAMDALGSSARTCRQLDGRARGARGRAARAGSGRRPRAAVPGARVRAARLAAGSCACCGRSSGCSPTRSAAAGSSASSGRMFADRDLVDPSVADIVVDEFERIYRSAGARLAFLASARAIYLEPPFGRDGFYPRLEALRAARAVRLGARTTG